jgi:hypothetical protein
MVAWVLIAVALLEQSNGLRAAALWTSGIGAIVAACFLLPVDIVNNEGGVPVGVTRRAAGYWLWLISMLCALASSMLLPVRLPSASAIRKELSS